MVAQANGEDPVSDAFVTSLISGVQQLQSIMVAVATGGPRMQDKEDEYVDLYQQIDQRIRFLQSRGIALPNPNQFRSLWDWYGRWRLDLPNYQSRREYIQHLYDSVLIPLQHALDQPVVGNEVGDGLSRSIKLSVYQQTIQTSIQGPQEIQASLTRFATEHPNPLKTAFIMMRFGTSKVHMEIALAIRSALLPFQIEGLRADDKQYHDDLFPNIQTYMHGCGFGIAVFERIESDEFNPNVSLEVGYMLALRKSVCLLKDKTLKTLHTDLVGKLYSPFDPYDTASTIGAELTKWLSDRNFT